jgi:N6-adenosine-specific RNA methylase IME4
MAGAMPMIDERLKSHIPPLRPDEHALLEESILREGCREPLAAWNGLLVDGHNRLEICRKHGLPFSVREVSFEDIDEAIAWIEDNQLGRRNLTADAFAYFIGRKYERRKAGHGGARIASRQNDDLKTAGAVASEHGLSPRTVERAAEFARNVDTIAESLGEAVRPALLSGQENLTRKDVAEIAEAAPEAAATAATQQLVFSSAQEALDWVKAHRRAKARAAKEANDALKAATPPPVAPGRFGTIVIDPPWDMKKIERDLYPGQVDFEYPTMSEADLAGFPVPDMAADACHLFCWTTQKFLPAALRLCESWGFRYVLTMVWHKPGGFQPFGLPQYNCEFVVYARRGSPDFVDTKAFPCAFQAPRREHSRKPDEFYDLIRRVTADGRIDVFSREPREGFEQMGNETDKFGAAA